MNVVVFGGTGGTGGRVIAQALAAGHRVRAVVRRPEALKLRHEGLSVHPGNVLELASFASILSGQDAVLSALGTGTSRRPTTLYSEGTRNLMQAMRAAGVGRLVAVTAGGFVANPDDGLLLAYAVKPLIGRILKEPYADMMRMEAAVRQSDRDWTVVRPARLTDGPPRGRYRTVIGETGSVPGGLRISRADLAGFMITTLADRHTFKQVVGIAY